MKNILILLTHTFPDDKNEVFLWNEIPFLEYDKVYICSMVGVESNNFFANINPQYSIIRCGSTLKFPKGTIWWVKSLFVKEFWIELKNIISQHKCTKELFVKLLRTTSYGERIVKTIKKSVNFHDDECRYVVYSYWMTSLAYAAIKLKKECSSIKLTFSRCHGHDLYCYRYKEDYIEYQQYYLDCIDLISPISNDGIKYLTDRYGDEYKVKLELNRLGTIDYGIQEYSGNKRGITVISCSGVIRLKRINLIIDALKHIDGISIDWIHYGDGPLFHEIQKYAMEQLDEKNNITYRFAGRLKNEELMMTYRDATYDLFINVSETEGIPVSIMEALSFGIPVIATNVGGCNELVDASCGYLIDKNFSPEELARLITQFNFLNEGSKIEMRRNARQKWEEKYSAEINFRTLHKKLISNIDIMED